MRVRNCDELVDVRLDCDLDAPIPRSSLRVVVRRHRIELAIPSRRQDARRDSLLGKETHDFERARRRQLPIRGKALRLDRHVVRVTGDLEVPTYDRLEHRADLLECRLPAGSNFDLARLEQDIIRKLQDHSAVAERDRKITRIDHLLQSNREIAIELRALFREHLGARTPSARAALPSMRSWRRSADTRTSRAPPGRTSII